MNPNFPFSLSTRGGLLFPWHIGALAGLTYHKALDEVNPLAGSSAGAIAVASHGAGVRPEGKRQITAYLPSSKRSSIVNTFLRDELNLNERSTLDLRLCAK